VKLPFAGIHSPHIIQQPPPQETIHFSPVFADNPQLIIQNQWLLEIIHQSSIIRLQQSIMVIWQTE